MANIYETEKLSQYLAAIILSLKGRVHLLLQ